MPINGSRINIAQQMDFIRRRGERVNYFRGMKCPCTIMAQGSNLPDANRANPACEACHGIGWVYQSAGIIVGLVENVNQFKDLILGGMLDAGDLVFSPDLRYTLSDYDKIQLTWPQGIPYEGELIVRGNGDTDKSYYGIISVPETGCISVDAVTGKITNYAPNADFTFSGNTITWVTQNRPSAGSVYSIKYNGLIDWIVFTPPQPRRERGTDLGQRVILKKKHVVFNGV